MIRAAALALLLGVLAAPAAAQTCAATVSDLNFGQVSVRAGAVNATSGTVRVSCTGAVVAAVGACLRFGPGQGGAGGGQSPRYMRRGDGAPLAYELRPGGNGAAFGTLTTLFVEVPIVLGSGNVTVPIYGDVTSASVGVGTGPYASVFSGASNIQLTYGAVTCLSGGTTVAVPGFTVTADVVASCEVDASSLDFGNISGGLATAATAQATINVRCTENTAYRVFLDNGSGPGATGPTDRRLRNGTASLRYGLYRDAALALPWGDTIGTAPAGTGIGANQGLRVYGAIHAGQTTQIGLYTDSVVVTVAY